MEFKKNELLEEYINFATEYGYGIDNADHKKANLNYKKLQTIFEKMYKGNIDKNLLILLDHNNPWVALWAASHTLEINERKSLETLRNITTLKGLISITAEITIKEWGAGNFKFR